MRRAAPLQKNGKISAAKARGEWGLWVYLNVTAARVAVLDYAYLRGDALAHRVGVADDTHFLALLRL